MEVGEGGIRGLSQFQNLPMGYFNSNQIPSNGLITTFLTLETNIDITMNKKLFILMFGQCIHMYRGFDQTFFRLQHPPQHLASLGQTMIAASVTASSFPRAKNACSILNSI